MLHPPHLHPSIIHNSSLRYTQFRLSTSYRIQVGCFRTQYPSILHFRHTSDIPDYSRFGGARPFASLSVGIHPCLSAPTLLDRTRTISTAASPLSDMSGQLHKHSVPPLRPASPAPLSSDLARKAISKQQKNNYHSSSLSTMLNDSVNKTALHPGGVA